MGTDKVVLDSLGTHQITALALLPADSLLTAEALAAHLGRSVDSIDRAVGRGELPAGADFFGCRRWTPAAIQEHVRQLLAGAAREQERKDATIRRIG